MESSRHISTRRPGIVDLYYLNLMCRIVTDFFDHCEPFRSQIRARRACLDVI